MKKTITHSGMIERIEYNHIVVRIAQMSGCGSCKMAGHCNASESKDKLIDVYHVDTSKYQVGDHVVVSADLKSGYKAVAGDLACRSLSWWRLFCLLGCGHTMMQWLL